MSNLAVRVDLYLVFPFILLSLDPLSGSDVRMGLSCPTHPLIG
jgi:hypothetical protein